MYRKKPINLNSPLKENDSLKNSPSGSSQYQIKPVRDTAKILNILCESTKNTNGTTKIQNIIENEAERVEKVNEEKKIQNIQKETQCIEEEKKVLYVANNEFKKITNDVKPESKDNTKLVYNVVFGKKSAKKHKTFSDDGVLEVFGKGAVLKDSTGTIIGRATVQSELITEGYLLSIGSREVEIIDKVTVGYSSNDKDVNDIVKEPPTKKFKGLLPRTPINVLKKGSSNLKKGDTQQSETLIMPYLCKTTLWEEDDILIKEVEVTVDYCLATVLRQHQRFGVIFLYQCIMGISVPNYYGAILADEMGLGKTLQCITLIWTLLKKGPYKKPVLKRVLIVTPSSLCNSWGKEFIRWLGRHRIFPYIADVKRKPKDFGKLQKDNVLIISYDLFIRHFEEIKELTFDLILCDEGHRLKNGNIKAAQLLNEIKCARRILVSGTPIQNDLQEFYMLVNFVNPGILGAYSEYKQSYEDPIVSSQLKNVSDEVLQLGKAKADELYEHTKTFILRRTQETINKYLPSKHEMVVFCKLSQEQEYLYSLISDKYFNKEVLVETNIPHLTLITALKKICNHSILFTNDTNILFNNYNLNDKKLLHNSKSGYQGKITIVQTLIQNLKQSSEKLVLISYFTKTLDLFENLIREEKLEYFRLDGSTPAADRNKIIEQFNSNNNKHKIFLLSAKAGGVGLNLSGASRLVLFDSDWNPASDAQAMARIWRDGQKRDVYIYRLLTTGTIEEKIYQRQINKTNLSEAIVDSKYLTSMKFSSDELKDIFTLATNTASLTHDLMKCTCDGSQTDGQSKFLFKDKSRRESQFFLKDHNKKNLTINQLLDWEHYKLPIPPTLLEEIMLQGVSQHISFIFKNTVN
ncbi:DNA repair and recombination protein RAD54B-like isoform X2 [Prorops nasuta]|uniref:DNA repair and recombination protein RAD54B-like isoform X2 n=1 Tax=Prorops nasuta TaxID=863751 RepID=UPI0034CFDF3D